MALLTFTNAGKYAPTFVEAASESWSESDAVLVSEQSDEVVKSKLIFQLLLVCELDAHQRLCFGPKMVNSSSWTRNAVVVTSERLFARGTLTTNYCMSRLERGTEDENTNSASCLVDVHPPTLIEPWKTVLSSRSQSWLALLLACHYSIVLVI